MSNTHSKRIHKLITAGFLVTGILVTITSTQHFVTARLTGPGSFISETIMPVDEEMDSEETIDAPTYHQAAPLEDDTGPILVGMLLVLAGFSFHALYVVRDREPVHVHVKRERVRMKTRRRKA